MFFQFLLNTWQSRYQQVQISPFNNIVGVIISKNQNKIISCTVFYMDAIFTFWILLFSLMFLCNELCLHNTVPEWYIYVYWSPCIISKLLWCCKHNWRLHYRLKMSSFFICLAAPNVVMHIDSLNLVFYFSKA